MKVRQDPSAANGISGTQGGERPRNHSEISDSYGYGHDRLRVRFLIRGYEPKEKPDDRFYNAMREFSAIGNNLHQISLKANALGFIDAQKLNAELDRLHKFQADVERQYLRPGESNLKWQ